MNTRVYILVIFALGLILILHFWEFKETRKDDLKPIVERSRFQNMEEDILKQLLFNLKAKRTSPPGTKQQKAQTLSENKNVTREGKNKQGNDCTPEDKTSAFIAQLQSNDSVYLPERSVLQQLNLMELEFLYHRYVENLQYACTRKVRLGNLGDGGWDICEEKVFRPNPPCLVYSFGINRDFTFDDATIKRYGCEVHSFDHTMKDDSYQRGPLNLFHAIGIAEQDQKAKNGREMLTLRTIRERLNHTNKQIPIIKLDVEGWEKVSVPEMIISGSLSDVTNLALEFHLSYNAKSYRVLLNLLIDLYEEGYRIFWTHQNPACRFVSRCSKELRSRCQEISFVRV